MARENPTWGRRRIQAELRFLGYEVAELTVAKYMRRPSPRPSSTWRTFLEAHIGEIVAVDFFVVPTLTFRLLFGFLILRHDRRELVHVNVTDHPTAAWAAHQLVESFPEETAPKYLLRDRDAIYGDVFVRRVKGLGMSEILIAPRAPWQNPFAERVIGSIRRECLDHVIVINERHLRRLLRSYLAYYNATRPHQSLDNDSPRRREVQSVRGRAYRHGPAGRRASSPLPARRLTARGLRLPAPPRSSAPTGSVMRRYRYLALRPVSASVWVPARTFSEPMQHASSARITFLTGTPSGAGWPPPSCSTVCPTRGSHRIAPHGFSDRSRDHVPRRPQGHDA